MGEPVGNGWLYPEALECWRRNIMGVVSAFIAAPQLELPASDFLSPISWLLGSLAPWLLAAEFMVEEFEKGRIDPFVFFPRRPIMVSAFDGKYEKK